MTFVVRMVGREMRASWRRLLFFFICIAVGVGAIVALRSVIQSVRMALASEARNLLAADVLIRTSRPCESKTETRGQLSGPMSSATYSSPFRSNRRARMPLSFPGCAEGPSTMRWPLLPSGLTRKTVERVPTHMELRQVVKAFFNSAGSRSAR